jgi:hypothetical protein
MEGSGEMTALNIELLQVAYAALDLTHAPAAMSNPTMSTDFSGVKSQLRGPPCPRCTESKASARRAGVALKDCCSHGCLPPVCGMERRSLPTANSSMSATLPPAQEAWSQDSPPKNQRRPNGEPVSDHATSYPSADGIDWDPCPYEDTQGPLLAPYISRPIDSIPNLPALPESVIMPPTEGVIREDGFHVDRWIAGVPEVLPSAT